MLFPNQVNSCFLSRQVVALPPPILLIAYPFAILDHYRIEIGTYRAEKGEKPEDRHKGEPIEKVIVIVAGALAVFTFVTIVFAWNF